MLCRPKKGILIMRYRIFFNFIVLVGLLISCAGTNGPRVVQTYDNALDRNEIAIVRLEQKMSLRVLACDGIAVPKTVRYLLVRPGRHELIFSISGQTIVEVYQMTNKKYLDAIGGHTYILRSETGIFSIGNKWFPEVVDVTDDPKLHVTDLPLDEEQKND
jgi:hypothetical protein